MRLRKKWKKTTKAGENRARFRNSTSILEGKSLIFKKIVQSTTSRPIVKELVLKITKVLTMTSL